MDFFKCKFFKGRDSRKYSTLNIKELNYLLSIALELEDYHIAIEIRDEIALREGK